MQFNYEEIKEKYIAPPSAPNTNYDNIIKMMRAILSKKEVRFVYNKYSIEPPRKRIFHPGIIREYDERWYVMGLEQPLNKIKTFAFDRILNVEITNVTFSQIQINWENYCKDSFGLTIGEIDPVSIKLSFSPEQLGYLKSKPLHHSQEIKKETDKAVILKIKVRPSWELYSTLLSHGSNVKVIEPLFVKNELQNRLRKAIEQYN